ncbi:MAG: DUF2235 domain-containing protein [Shimia sp.]|uniref:DUF2235 domain-containing protein n=1 Tax=Shimia sp. TaxID=1954381 RepID=UPI0025E4FE2B|nr:DUF2235 domain-containing protein [Shimia sp.]MCH2069552.1 DUF2235 domain-containing protein [Shimia sp.]
MPKNIVILLDGTSNGITSQRTNILRLYGCLRKSETQLVYYDPGVGTMGAQGTWSRRVQKASELWGMATGAGIDHNVKEAYRFLVENYSDGKAGDGERDRIYLFGFSRGAYTARILAGFIYTIGLIKPRNLNLVDYAYRAYKRIGESADDDQFAEVRLYERILATDRPPVRFLGLFDTVASVIEPGPGILPQLKHHASTSRNPGVESVRHAVALDERRRMFRALLWPNDQVYHQNPFATDKAVPQDALEVWFNGSHGDVGGGYKEDQSGLAKIPLQWMIEEAREIGLEFVSQTVNRIVLGTNPEKPYSQPDALADRHTSMNLAWKVLEYVPLPTKRDGMSRIGMTKERPRIVPVGARIHASVVARAKEKGGLEAHVPKDHRTEGDPKDWI